MCVYCKQAADLSSQLADLHGQEQNERLAVPLLRLAGAVQAALAWQQKVCSPLLAVLLDPICLDSDA